MSLNLQRAASACINIELPWNPAVLEQRIGRIHRLGQQRTPHGGLVIEAPPEIFSTLAALFAGRAQLLQAAAPAPAP